MKEGSRNPWRYRLQPKQWKKSSSHHYSRSNLKIPPATAWALPGPEAKSTTSCALRLPTGHGFQAPERPPYNCWPPSWQRHHCRPGATGGRGVPGHGHGTGCPGSRPTGCDHSSGNLCNPACQVCACMIHARGQARAQTIATSIARSGSPATGRPSLAGRPRRVRALLDHAPRALRYLRAHRARRVRHRALECRRQNYRMHARQPGDADQRSLGDVVAGLPG